MFLVGFFIFKSIIMENTIEINGKKYVVFQTEVAINKSGIYYAELLEEKIKKFDGIETHNEIIQSFYGINKARIKFLIPEENAVEFSKSPSK